jgi:hypothetical protein
MISLTNVGSPTITVAVAPITQLSSLRQVNIASVSFAGIR